MPRSVEAAGPRPIAAGQNAPADVVPTRRLSSTSTTAQIEQPPRVSDAGLAVTLVPDLLADWRARTIDAAVYDAAALGLFGAPSYELTEEQHRSLASQLGPLYAGIEKQLAGTQAQRQQTIAQALATYAPFLGGAIDPFTPIAHGPRPYPGERVLWENREVMVIADAFGDKRGGGPKALVVPKRPYMFPTEAPAALIATLAKIAAAAGDALAQAGGSARPVDVWINPPQNLMVKQLHVHVQPHLTPWRALGLDDKQTEKAKETFYADVQRLLAQRLGPPS